MAKHAPTHLDADSKRIWRETYTFLVESDLWDDVTAPILDLYVTALARARDARLVSLEDPFVEGSKGQLVRHPAYQVAREAEQDAHKYAESLLLTPAARRRLKVTAAQEELPGLAELLG